jgi:hypothetical protein
MQIYDKNDFQLYKYTANSTTVSVRPSDFSHSFISSSSEVNGESSIYSLSITLSVDTPVLAVLEIQMPTELEFDYS